MKPDDWTEGRFPLRKIRNNVGEIIGETNNYFIYTDPISVAKCSCPDFVYRNDRCKHITHWFPFVEKKEVLIF